MEVVAGLSLKNLQPRVWDPDSPYHLPDLKAVMISYADFQRMPLQRTKAMKIGLHKFLGATKGTKMYLDNGAFFFANNSGEPNAAQYGYFVKRTNPDWRPVRFDVIPFPTMSPQKQAACYRRTMKMNRNYQHDGYVPVVHAGKYLSKYLDEIESHDRLNSKPFIALGGLVPNLLRTPKAAAYSKIVDDLLAIRKRFPSKRIHVFGIGGTATLHLAALLGVNTVDSSGWRNRAARGIIQLSGSGERIIANLGSWRGRQPSRDELMRLEKCTCPACTEHGIIGLKSGGLTGFCNRATHNLWILLKEAEWVTERLRRGTYKRCYKKRLDNTIYLPLITKVIRKLEERE